MFSNIVHGNPVCLQFKQVIVLHTKLRFVSYGHLLSFSALT